MKPIKLIPELLPQWLGQLCKDFYPRYHYNCKTLVELLRIGIGMHCLERNAKGFYLFFCEVFFSVILLVFALSVVVLMYFPDYVLTEKIISPHTERKKVFYH